MPRYRRRSFRRRKPRYRRRRFKGRRYRKKMHIGSMMKSPLPRTLFTQFKVCKLFSFSSTSPQNGVVEKAPTNSNSFPIELTSIADPFGTWGSEVDPFLAKMANFYDKYQVHKAIVIVRATLREAADVVFWTQVQRAIGGTSPTKLIANTDNVTALCLQNNLKLHKRSMYSADKVGHTTKKFHRVIKIKPYMNVKQVTDPQDMIAQTMTSNPVEAVNLWVGYTTQVGENMDDAVVDTFNVEVVQYATLTRRDDR